MPPVLEAGVKFGQFLIAHDSLRPELHKKDEQEGDHYPFEYLQRPQGFQQERKKDRRKDRPRKRAHAPKVDHDHALGGLHDVERSWVDKTKHMSEESARDSGKP